MLVKEPGGRKPRTHYIKCTALFYDDVESGLKPFEMRLDDREYRVGDLLFVKEIVIPELLTLNKFRPEAAGDAFRADVVFTGRTCLKRVTYILTHKMFDPVPEGYVIMGLEPITYNDASKITGFK